MSGLDFFEKDRLKTFVAIRDFKNFPLFVLSDNLIYIHSHHCELSNVELWIKQDIYHYKVKTRICLRSDDLFNNIHIRLNVSIPKFNDMNHVRSFFEELNAKGLWHNTNIISNHKYYFKSKQEQKKADVKSIENYTDEELLKILFDRSMARVGDYRPKETFEDNVVRILDVAA
jgi:hypothetical protein